MRVLGFEGDIVDKAIKFAIEGGAEEARMFAEVDEEEVGGDEEVQEEDEEGEQDEEEEEEQEDEDYDD